MRMTSGKSPPNAPTPEQLARKERQAEQLRANLARRKERARAQRGETANTGKGPAAEDDGRSEG